MNWINRWENNQIGWHKSDFNSRMIEFLPNLNLQKGSEIFVPLCGKSLDMIYLLNQGFKVIGVELSKIAITDFFAENNIEFEIQKNADFNIYKSANITIYQGDIFNLKKKYLQDISAIYDRASLVALNPQLRSEYGKLFDGIISRGVAYLLLTLDYNQEQSDGPPFAVSKNEIENIFANWEILQVDSFNDIKNETKFKESGHLFLNKDTYILKNKHKN
jgi:thiopurine S-methyltransferase